MHVCLIRGGSFQPGGYVLNDVRASKDHVVEIDEVARGTSAVCGAKAEVVGQDFFKQVEHCLLATAALLVSD